MPTDPVCGSDVSKEDAAATAEYNGETFYFDSEECKEEFVQNRGQYG